MLINLRNALMSGKRLPYDAEVEWLYNSGLTQYINTGIIPTSLTEVSLGFDIIEPATNLFRTFGGTFIQNNISATYAILSHETTQGSNAYNFRVNYNDTINATLAVGSHDVVMNEYGTRALKVDGTTMGTFTGSISVNLPIFLFCRNTSGVGETQYSIPIKLRYCKIKDDNGTLVRDYIPVRKGTVGYLYDRVSGKLFGNAGTGDFVVGQDVVPVEWLEGGQLDSGIAFIDTGYTPNSSTKIESTSAILSAWGYSGRFGNRARLVFGVANGSLYLAQGGHYYIGGYTAGTFYSFVNDIQNRTVSVEGVGSTSTTAVSDWYSQLYPVYLFASNTAPISGTVVNGKQLDTNSLGQIRMKSCGIWENNTPVRKFLPVRVGTDATSWEGAMMDVLTRRIYRNAGTGAFTYGNDLKYPIPAS